MSKLDSPVYALLRESDEGADTVLVLANTDVEKANPIALANPVMDAKSPLLDLLGQALPESTAGKLETVFKLPPGGVYCLGVSEKPVGLSGDDYRLARARTAWALELANKILPVEAFESFDWQRLAQQVDLSPKNFLAAMIEFVENHGSTP